MLVVVVVVVFVVVVVVGSRRMIARDSEREKCTCRARQKRTSD